MITRARKSIASFKLREKLPIGVMVTLRRNNMWDFADRLINLALPRTRDFKGVSPGHYLRRSWQLHTRHSRTDYFPEINYDKVDKIKGMNVTFVTTAANDDEGRALLKALGMPFRN
ncbi:MAG: hypothetical protein R3A47_00560 [Polyangiales bacterium]